MQLDDAFCGCNHVVPGLEKFAARQPDPCRRTCPWRIRKSLQKRIGPGLSATHAVDHGERIGWHLIAAPSDVAVRAHKYKLAFVNRRTPPARRWLLFGSARRVCSPLRRFRSLEEGCHLAA